MNKKIITLFLLVFIAFIARILFVSQKNINYVGDICTYSLPAGEVDAKFKKEYRKCQVSILMSMSVGRFKCTDIKKPDCLKDENSTLLCQALIERNPEKGPQDECEAEFNCPDDLSTYKELINNCNKK